MPQGDPRPGEKYLHFKNKLYQIITIAQHSETGEKMVIYQALYGTFQTYARPLSMFVSPVDREKYPQAKQKYRFQWVEFKKTGTKPDSQKEASKPEAAEQKEASRPKPAEQKEVSRAEPAEQGAASMELAEQETLRKEPVKPPQTAEEKLLAFFDADTIEEKYAVLSDMKDEVTDRMINNMAIVMDVVIEEGPLDLRYEELKACLRTMQRYECSRLR